VLSSVDLLLYAVLLLFGAPCQLPLLTGQEHGQTIPLADIGGVEDRATMLSRCSCGHLAIRLQRKLLLDIRAVCPSWSL